MYNQNGKGMWGINYWKLYWAQSVYGQMFKELHDMPDWLFRDDIITPTEDDNPRKYWERLVANIESQNGIKPQVFAGVMSQREDTKHIHDLIYGYYGRQPKFTTGPSSYGFQYNMNQMRRVNPRVNAKIWERFGIPQYEREQRIKEEEYERNQIIEAEYMAHERQKAFEQFMEDQRKQKQDKIEAQKYKKKMDKKRQKAKSIKQQRQDDHKDKVYIKQKQDKSEDKRKKKEEALIQAEIERKKKENIRNIGDSRLMDELQKDLQYSNMMEVSEVSKKYKFSNNWWKQFHNNKFGDYHPLRYNKKQYVLYGMTPNQFLKQEASRWVNENMKKYKTYLVNTIPRSIKKYVMERPDIEYVRESVSEQFSKDTRNIRIVEDKQINNMIKKQLQKWNNVESLPHHKFFNVARLVLTDTNNQIPFNHFTEEYEHFTNQVQDEYRKQYEMIKTNGGYLWYEYDSYTDTLINNLSDTSSKVNRAIRGLPAEQAIIKFKEELIHWLMMNAPIGKTTDMKTLEQAYSYAQRTYGIKFKELKGYIKNLADRDWLKFKNNKIINPQLGGLIRNDDLIAKTTLPSEKLFL